MNQKDYMKLSADELRRFFAQVLDGIHDRIYVADNKGTIIMANKKAVQDYNFELEYEDLIGSNLADLVEKGYVTESLILKVLKSCRAQGLICHEPEGHELLSWANPVLREGEIDFVVSTEWDMENLDILNELLTEGHRDNEIVKSELQYYRRRTTTPECVIVESDAMHEVMELSAAAARTDATVLLEGETGTGKEVIMRYIHRRSPRAEAPLIEVNCAAVPENLFESEFFGYVKGSFTGAMESGKRGYFEMAHGGTLFLDEIETLSLSAQTKLLRVLQTKEVMRIGSHVTIPLDVKIIAATNQNLEELVERDLFRQDLYYRFNVFPITIPPLRERRADIPGLISHFNRCFNEKYKCKKTIHPGDMDVFLNYSWPGNVRELQNIIERAFITEKNDIIPRSVWEKLINIMEDIKEEKHSNLKSFQEYMNDYEKAVLLSFLPYYQNSRQFGELLGIDKSTVNRKFKKYNIKKK